jgi:molybdopterin-guanine dinucleotide biosynthesis protein A
MPDCGPLGGLDAALAAARHDALVLVACDMPFVTSRLLGHLLALTSEADAVVPRTERGYHPLCAAYTRACQPPIAERLDRRQFRMVDFLADVRVRVVCGDELAALGDHHRLLANVNTPAEYDGLGPAIGHKL